MLHLLLLLPILKHWKYDHVGLGEDYKREILKAGQPENEFALHEEVVIVLTLLQQPVPLKVTRAHLSRVPHSEFGGYYQQRVLYYQRHLQHRRQLVQQRIEAAIALYLPDEVYFVLDA